MVMMISIGMPRFTATNKRKHPEHLTKAWGRRRYARLSVTWCEAEKGEFPVGSCNPTKKQWRKGCTFSLLGGFVGTFGSSFIHLQFPVYWVIIHLVICGCVCTLPSVLFLCLFFRLFDVYGPVVVLQLVLVSFVFQFTVLWLRGRISGSFF